MVRLADQHNWIFFFELVRIVDGDTIHVRVDKGFTCEQVFKLRFEGIDTPEIFFAPPDERKEGERAKTIVNDWFHRHDQGCEGEGYWVRTVKDRTTYGRYRAAEIQCWCGEDLIQYMKDMGYEA